MANDGTAGARPPAPPFASWDDLIAHALRAEPQTRARLLATVCLAADPVVHASTLGERGLPIARPVRAQRRRAAEELLAGDAPVAARIVALATGHALEPGSEESQRVLAGKEDAFRLAAEAADRVSMVWAGAGLVEELRRQHRAKDAVPWAKEVAALLDEPGLQGRGPFAAVDAHLLAEGAGDSFYRHVVEVFAWRAVVRIRNSDGDLGGVRAGIDRMAEAARAVRGLRPTLYTVPLKHRARLQRQLGELADLAEFEEAAARAPLSRVTYLQQLAENRRSIGDHDGSADALREAVRVYAGLRFPDLGEAAPAELAAAVGAIPPGERRRVNTLGNLSYDLAARIVLSGRPSSEPAAHAEASAWLDLADTVWDPSWAMNGIQAVRYQRARLRGAGDPEAVLEELLDVSRRAHVPGLSVNALSYPAYRLPGADLAPLVARLTETLDQAWTAPLRGRLLAARAWLTRRGTPWEDLATSRRDAAEAIQLLRGQVADRAADLAHAHWASALDADPDRLDERLDHCREAVVCLGRMLLNATTVSLRRHIAAEWAPLVIASLEAALAADRPDVVDLVSEVVRRDGLAVLLAQAGGEDTAPEAVRSVLADFSAAFAAGDDQSGDDRPAPGEGEEEPDRDPEARSRYSAEHQALVAARQREAAERAERIVGPLGSMRDPETLFSATARDVLALRGERRENAFLLQLMPTTLPLTGASRRPRLYRRVTWIQDGRPREHADLVDVPGELFAPEAEGAAGREAALWRDGRPLLPEPLLAALEKATPDDPIRLLVVPTGLFHLHWDGLLTASGAPLLQRAVVSLHTSLTAIRHELTTGRPSPTSGSIAVFDTAALRQTAVERNALERWLPELTHADSRADLAELETLDRPAAASPASPGYHVFAMGVHGFDDAEGWGQAKLLPNGDILTAVEALGFTFPDICVLASCHSRVRTAGGIDTAGFPTAMFARGATTVIGSVGEIPDHETAHILGAYYAHLAAGIDPVTALRTARLDWLRLHPSAWQQPHKWARLVAYGGARHGG